MSLVAEPNINSPANVDAAKMWRDKRDEFVKVTKTDKNLKNGYKIGLTPVKRIEVEVVVQVSSKTMS
jgi:hypothetical protein